MQPSVTFSQCVTGRRRCAHAGAIVVLLERVQQNEISLLESVQGDVMALVNDGYEAPVALYHNLERLFVMGSCGHFVSVEHG